jgi:hypothetical protein
LPVGEAHADSRFNQGPVKILRAGAAQKFSIKVWLKIFWLGLVDRYATFKQGLEGRLKFSRQVPVSFFVKVCPDFFNQGSVENFHAGSGHFLRAWTHPDRCEGMGLNS